MITNVISTDDATFLRLLVSTLEVMVFDFYELGLTVCR